VSPLAARVPKPTKLKRIAKVKDSHIVSGVCGGNNCSLICKEGKVFMFGPTEGDIVDKNTGRSGKRPKRDYLVLNMEMNRFRAYLFRGWVVFAGVLTDLLGVPASQVALGRSHVCILAQNGTVYTFGGNQYGQCGRDFVPQTFANNGKYRMVVYCTPAESTSLSSRRYSFARGKKVKLKHWVLLVYFVISPVPSRRAR